MMGYSCIDAGREDSRDVRIAKMGLRNDHRTHLFKSIHGPLLPAVQCH